MKRGLLIIILIVSLCGIVSAQSEFMNGYIIKKDGSYTYGQLKYIVKRLYGQGVPLQVV